MKSFIKYRVGRVAITESNILVQDLTELDDLKFWEDRLKRLAQPFAVIYSVLNGQKRYSVYTKVGGKDNAFRNES